MQHAPDATTETFCLKNLGLPPAIRHNAVLRVISLKALRTFWERYPDAEEPLRSWYKTALVAKWSPLADARKTYPHADGVRTPSGTLTVFNVGGNKYRLVARIRYDFQLINVRAVLTHREYDAGKWKE